jgi:hypothetical protein
LHELAGLVIHELEAHEVGIGHAESDAHKRILNSARIGADSLLVAENVIRSVEPLNQPSGDLRGCNHADPSELNSSSNQSCKRRSKLLRHGVHRSLNVSAVLVAKLDEHVRLTEPERELRRRTRHNDVRTGKRQILSPWGRQRSRELCVYGPEQRGVMVAVASPENRIAEHCL